MEYFNSPSMLRRLRAVAVSFASCVAVSARGPTLVSNNPKQPPDIEAVWELDIESDFADSKQIQAIADGDELFVWGNIGRASGPNGVGLSVFDLATGDVLWESSVEVRNAWLTDDAVVVESQSGRFRVVDRASGESRFSIETAKSDSPVAATADGVAALEEAGDGFNLTFYDIDSGKKLWSEKVENSGSGSDVYVSAPTKTPNVHNVAAAGKQRNLRTVQNSPLVYAYTSGSESSGEYVPYAVADGHQGEGVEVDTANQVAPNGLMTVTAAGNAVTLVGREPCDIVYTIVNEELSEVDRFDMSGGPTCRNDDSVPPETHTDGMVYTVDFSGHPQLIDADTGEIVWTGPEKGTAFTFADGVATYGYKGYAKAVDIDTDEQLWAWDYESMELRDGYLAFSEVQYANRYGVAGDVVLLGSEESTFAVRGDGGEPLWSYAGAMVDVSGEYVVLLSDPLADKQQLQVSKLDG